MQTCFIAHTHAREHRPILERVPNPSIPVPEASAAHRSRVQAMPCPPNPAPYSSCLPADLAVHAQESLRNSRAAGSPLAYAAAGRTTIADSHPPSSRRTLCRTPEAPELISASESAPDRTHTTCGGAPGSPVHDSLWMRETSSRIGGREACP